MSTEVELGRIPLAEMNESLLMDQPSLMSQAMLTKMDQIIDKLNAILTAVEAATDGDSLYAALDTADIKAEITKLKFNL